jgi:hypothetical protein
VTRIYMDLRLFRQKGGIGVEIAAEMAGQQAGLEMRQETDGGFLVEEGMVDFVLLALLPGGEDFLAGIVLEEEMSQPKQAMPSRLWSGMRSLVSPSWRISMAAPSLRR